MRNETINVNVNALKDIMKEKGYSSRRLAEECGLGHSTIDKYIKAEEFPVPVAKLITLILGCKEDDIRKRPLPSASAIIKDAMINEEVIQLRKEVEALRLDLQNMAKLLLQINKTTQESKAQEELNAEQLSAIFTKSTDINSNVNKIYGKITHKY